MHHRFLPALAAGFWLCQPGSAAAGEGTVIWKNQDCRYFILQTAKGYGLYEWVSGAMANDGDIIEGDLEAGGSLQVHNRTADLPASVFVAARAAQRNELESKIPARCH